jgi:hypothetical protein
MMEIAHQFNKKLSNTARLFIQNAPFIDEPGPLQYYTSVIYDLLNKKALSIPDDMKLSVYLHELSPDKRMQATASDYPAIAALGYAVARLEAYRPTPVHKLPRVADSDYDALG